MRRVAYAVALGVVVTSPMLVAVLAAWQPSRLLESILFVAVGGLASLVWVGSTVNTTAARESTAGGSSDGELRVIAEALALTEFSESMMLLLAEAIAVLEPHEPGIAARLLSDQCDTFSRLTEHIP